MTYVVNDACVDIRDLSCVKECPVDCIYQGDRMMYIHPDECIDCGACEAVCPVEAIYYDGDLTPEQQHLLDRSIAFFAPIGSPGGARRLGIIGYDHPDVARLPARELDGS